MSNSILRTAHGAAAARGVLLVAETPPIDELRPLNADDTTTNLASRRQRGRPFQPGNAAATNRGSSLTRIGKSPPGAPADQQRVRRKAATLKAARERELVVQHNAPLSSAVKVELVAWARATAWAEHYDRIGDAKMAASLAEKASGHQLKAIAIADREAVSNAKRRGPSDPLAGFYDDEAKNETKQ